MPFNWFKRPKKEESEKKAAPETPTQPAQPESKAAEPAPETEQPAIAQDLLAFAKAAYQNVQQQQTTSEPEAEPVAETPDTPTTALETAATETDTVEPDTTEPDATPEVEPEPSKPELSGPTASEPVVFETPTAQDDPAVPVTDDSSTSTAQPAWMRRSDALERLKETAIADDEPEELEQLPFDDDFLWSARVLAEQGRQPDEISLEEISWLKQLREGLGKTRRSLVNQLLAVVGQGPLNDEAVEEIEALLLQADVGIAATDYIIETLQSRLLEETLPPEEAIAYLKEILCKILDAPRPGKSDEALTLQDDQLNIWLMTGVNGAGKTTTVGKLANMAKQSGYTCLIAAADTFRAAAVEQVKVWGERTKTPVIANPGKNTDPAAVVFDAISAAQSRDAQLLLVDTAGRLQNKQNLMDELAKIRRIIDKKAPGAAIESLLVLDATLGQNGLRQAEVFAKAAQLSGVVLTKLDGTAKGGVALAVSQQLNLPIRFIGAGEGIEDLRPFSSYEFVEALLS